ncbi:GntR family transcriptional regulator [Arthrobacter sp. Br18]|uniref:GntR family transcriptional regulator n=1 Tax=Arthrobacter sp. Br18 TaxID=1312954 RepID=UPI0004AF48EE|nr:GntR family transcriptional regulator [Arthrobacter sp. Br18]
MPPVDKQGSNDVPAAPHRVKDEIRRDIIFGGLLPGTRVTEAALARKYAVSRVPVREALRALEAEGFVESKPYAGSTVSDIPADEADDLFLVREALESALARRAARRSSRQFAEDEHGVEWRRVRKDLALLLDEGDAVVAGDDLLPLPELNIRFHLGIAELSGSASLMALLRQISGKIEWLYATDVDNRGKQSWSEHRLVLAAIDAGDAAEAERLMGRHVSRSRTGYRDRFAGAQAHGGAGTPEESG